MTEHVPPVLSKESFWREHRLGFTDSRDAVLPIFVAAEDVDLDAQKINRHLRFRFRQAWHTNRVFFGGDDHRQVAPDAAIDEAAQFSLAVVVVIDVAERKIDMCAQVLQRALKTFGRGDSADRTDKSAMQSVEH